MVIETIRCYEGRNHARGEVRQLFTKIYRCKRCTTTWGAKPHDHNCKDNIRSLKEAFGEGTINPLSNMRV